MDYLVKSCQLGYGRAYNLAGFHFDNISNQQKTFLLFSASRQLGSTWGRGNEGLYLITGKGGIE